MRTNPRRGWLGWCQNCFAMEPMILRSAFDNFSAFNWRAQSAWLGLRQCDWNPNILSVSLQQERRETTKTLMPSLPCFIFIVLYRVGEKTGPFLEVYNSSVCWHRKAFHYQNVQLFVRSKNIIFNVTVFKYSLHKFKGTILHQYQELQEHDVHTQFSQNSQCQLLTSVSQQEFNLSTVYLNTSCHGWVTWGGEISVGVGGVTAAG